MKGDILHNDMQICLTKAKELQGKTDNDLSGSESFWLKALVNTANKRLRQIERET